VKRNKRLKEGMKIAEIVKDKQVAQRRSYRRAKRDQGVEIKKANSSELAF
jgi:hypothetical protein